MRLIILINGFSCSGKDTMADYIVKQYSSKFLKLSMADKLKKHTANKYNFDSDLTQTQCGKKTMIPVFNKSVRELLIEEALSLKKIYGNDFFIENLLHYIRLKNIKENILISDFRFKNEHTFLVNNAKLDYKVITVRINRFARSPVNSPSEYSLNNFLFDYEINNTSDIETFKKNIDKFLVNIFEMIY